MADRLTPADLEDLLLAEVERALEGGGYLRSIEQPFAQDVANAAVWSLYNSGAITEAAREAVERCSGRLVRGAVVKWGV